MKLLIIIPAYNESLSILRTVADIKKHCSTHDYIVINDGSTDDTKEVLEKNDINHITLPVNAGLAGAMQLGYKLAYEGGYDAAVQFDGDGQHRAEHIDEMFDEIKRGDDIVIGSRYKKKRKPLSPRMLGSRLISFSIALTTFKRIKDPTSGLRMISRPLIKQFAYSKNRAPEPDTIAFLMKCGWKVKEIQVEMDDRQHGSSYLTFVRSLSYMFIQVGSIFLIQPFRKKKRYKKVGVKNV